jgi:hypothetical protein
VNFSFYVKVSRDGQTSEWHVCKTATSETDARRQVIEDLDGIGATAIEVQTLAYMASAEEVKGNPAMRRAIEQALDEAKDQFEDD